MTRNKLAEAFGVAIGFAISQAILSRLNKKREAEQKKEEEEMLKKVDDIVASVHEDLQKRIHEDMINRIVEFGYDIRNECGTTQQCSKEVES